jgi:internalin A
MQSLLSVRDQPALSLPGEVWMLVMKELRFRTLLDLCTVSSWWNGLIYASVTKITTAESVGLSDTLLSRFTALRKLALRPCKITDDSVSKLLALTSLSLIDGSPFCKFVRVTDAAVSRLTDLRTLDLTRNRQITDQGVNRLCNLRRLVLTANRAISDNCLVELSQLLSLGLNSNSKITDNAISRLTTLTELSLDRNCSITNAGVSPLTALTRLRLHNCTNVSDGGVSQLTNLVFLDASDCRMSDRSLSRLVKLRSLYLNVHFTNAGISELANLTNLHVCENALITDDAIRKLVNLTVLDIGDNPLISDYGICGLTRLVELSLGYRSSSITDAGISDLQSLRKLRMDDCENSTITLDGLTRLRSLVFLCISNLNTTIREEEVPVSIQYYYSNRHAK